MKKKISLVLMCVVMVLLCTVPASAKVKLNKKSINYSTAATKFKRNYTLKITGTKKKVKWKSSNKKVATIKSLGKTKARVTLKGFGKATITATVKGKKYKCKVTVKKK